VKILDIFWFEKSFVIMMDFAERGDLSSLLRANPRYLLTFDKVRVILREILCGVESLHRAGIIHRDLKSSNILLTEKCQLLICDFGLSRPARLRFVEMTQAIQSLWYRAPEALLRDCHYTLAVDWWSVGVIAYELVHNEVMFQGESEIDMVMRIFKYKGTPEFDEMLGIEDYEMVTNTFRVRFPKFKGGVLETNSKRVVPSDL